ncbi:MAG: amidohydrolase family protein [Planctomycetes bacterium]|nr:amidohydrolase family protein [Planctomycetota bacterium]
MRLAPALSLLASALSLAAPRAQSDPGPDARRPLAFVGATILPVAGAPIEDGVLVVRDGRIEAIGPRAGTPVPADAVRHNLAGKVLIPGLVCTHSHVGAPAGADSSEPIQPECRVLDSLDVRDPGLRKARAGGLTTLNVMPGSGHLISGQTIYLKLRLGSTVDALCYRWPDGTPMGGLKMANGTNSMRRPPFPGTRGKSAALVRAIFARARAYVAAKERAAGDPEKLPPVDLRLEALAEALSGRRVVHFHTHRHDDILTAMRIADEFGLRIVLHHVSEAWKVADEIAARGVPCSLILVDSPGGKLETMDIDFHNGVELERRGARVAFHTDDGITDSRVFLRMGALAVRAGMSRDGALRALTLSGAEILDLADRIGSLEPGKDADFAVLSGDPFSVYTRVEQTWVEGRKVFDLADPQDRLFAEGGYGASDGQAWHLCCAGQGGGQ